MHKMLESKEKGKIMKCKVKSCSRKIYRKRYCRTHYRRWKNYGDVYIDIPIKVHGSNLSLPIQRKVLQSKPGYQYCQQCKKYKKAKEFPEARQCMCKLCERNIGLKKVHSIGNKEYNKLLKKQKGRCALCETKEPGGRYSFFCIDHNHKTGEIRGLLCWICNASVIGNIEKRKIPIARLVKYLKK